MISFSLLFGPVGPEMLIILLLIVLLFGASRIPKLARSAGQAVTEFQRGREASEEELEQMTLETETNNTETVENNR